MKIVMASMLACGALTTALAFNTTYAQDAEQRPGVAPGVTLPTAPDFASKFTAAMKTPEALAAGEAALKATADAYAGATAIEDTLTMTVSMGERKETQAFTIARDATGMRLNLQSIVITATGEKIFIETEEVADKYVGFAIEESMLATLTTKLPGFELPFPRMLVDSKATAGARMQVRSFLSQRSPHTTQQRTRSTLRAWAVQTRSFRSIQRRASWLPLHTVSHHPERQKDSKFRSQ